MASKVKYIIVAGLFGSLIMLTACTEFFDPVIDPQAEVLVVEGLVTNQEGPHWVRLSLAVPYSGSFQHRPVSNARVYVEDQHGGKYPFAEQEPGKYFSSSGFSAKNGFSYVLHIQTEEGENFQSVPQMLNPGARVDSLESRFTSVIVEQQQPDGEIVFNTVPGLEFTAEIAAGANAIPMLRFEAVVLVQFILYELGSGDPAFLYCRRKMPLGDDINVVVPDFESSVGEVVRHQVGFMPQSFVFFGGSPEWGLLYLNRRIIILRQYALNQDAYLFYKGLREQMSSEGMLFDPIPGQLVGNIRCVDDPDRMALGLFEVSAKYTSTFALIGEPINENRNSIWRIHDLDYLPDNDCSFEMPPADWLY